MAQRFIDINANTEHSSITVSQDGAALTLTNTVRVLYDDADNLSDIYDAIKRCGEIILRLNE